MKCALVIAAYRADDSVALLLNAAQSLAHSPWSGIAVVDSLGSGALPQLIRERGWRNVHYFSATYNLGAAGNLLRRLTWAAEAGYDYAYGINADGDIAPTVVAALLTAAERRRGARLGALYPLRRYPARDRYEVTGRTRFPVPFRGLRTAPTKPFRVHWASSNGALYALQPIRDGVLPWEDLWMGWEDLAYGFHLDDHGYEQWVEPTAILDDDYETKPVLLSWSLTDKPSWYAYYVTRNLILTYQRTQQTPGSWGALGARIAMEYATTTLFRGEKRRRLSLLTRGILDGVRGRGGMGPKPEERPASPT